MKGKVRLPPGTQIGGDVDHPDPQLRSSTTSSSSSSSSSAVLPSSCSGWWDGNNPESCRERQPWDDGEGVTKEPFGGAGSAFLQRVRELDFAVLFARFWSYK